MGVQKHKAPQPSSQSLHAAHFAGLSLDIRFTHLEGIPVPWVWISWSARCWLSFRTRGWFMWVTLCPLKFLCAKSEHCMNGGAWSRVKLLAYHMLLSAVLQSVQWHIRAKCDAQHKNALQSKSSFREWQSLLALFCPLRWWIQNFRKVVFHTRLCPFSFNCTCNSPLVKIEMQRNNAAQSMV